MLRNRPGRRFTRQGKVKGGTFTYSPFGPHAALLSENDPLDNGQTHPGAFKFFGRVQALKNPKELVDVLLVKTDAVVLYVVSRLAGIGYGSDFDDRGRLPTGEFDRIGEQVGENLT